MRRYRAVHVIGSLAIGGAEVSLLALVEKLQKAGFDNEVILLGSEDALTPRFLRSSVPVHRLNMARGRLPALNQVAELVRLGRALRPDLIQGWMAHGNLAGALLRATLFRSIPLFWSVHQTLGNFRSQPRTTRFAIRALALLSWMPRQIIYVSRASREQHVGMGFRDSRSIHIPNGVDTDAYRGGADRRVSARQRLGLSESARVVGHVARFHPAKDHPNLMAALATLLLDDTNACAVLIGHGLTSDNPAFASWLGDPRLSGRLLLLGPRHDVADLLPGFDVFCLSSASEACSVAVIEAMSCGLRCVVTDVGDSAWILGGTGAVVPAGDPPSLAVALRRLLAMPAASAVMESRRARERVLESFNQERMVERYRSLYLAAIERRAAAGS